MHSEFEKISKYEVPTATRKLSVLLILLSMAVTLLTIWFLPILDYSFSTSTPQPQIKPVELSSFQRPKPLKVYQEQVVNQVDHSKVEFTEILPKISKKIVNPRVLVNRQIHLSTFDLTISDDLSFRVPMQDLSFSGMDLGGLIFSLNQVDERPIALNKLQPNYPFRARRRGIEGEVLLSFVITEAGDVSQVKVLSSKPKGTFDDQAKQAVYLWKFKPAKKDGNSVSVIRKQLIKFGLKK